MIESKLTSLRVQLSATANLDSCQIADKDATSEEENSEKMPGVVG